MIEIITTKDGNRYIAERVSGRRRPGEILLVRHKGEVEGYYGWQYVSRNDMSQWHRYDVCLVLVYLPKVGTNTRNGSSKVPKG